MAEKRLGVKIEFPHNLISSKFYQPFGQFIVDLVYDECSVEIESWPSEKSGIYTGPLIICAMCRNPDKEKLRQRARVLQDALNKIDGGIKIKLVKAKLVCKR